jgi:hypothetical protein
MFQGRRCRRVRAREGRLSWSNPLKVHMDMLVLRVALHAMNGNTERNVSESHDVPGALGFTPGAQVRRMVEAYEHAHDNGAHTPTRLVM